MDTALTLLIVQGVLGTFDTLWYHEWRQRLPARPTAARELRLHAARDFAYSLVFAALAWSEWRGWLAWILGAVLVFEILITLWDFVEEDRTRPLPPGERVMHTIMAIVYGAFLANLVPQLVRWSAEPTGVIAADHGALSWILTVMAAGVLASGVRDLVASFGSRASHAPLPT